MSNLPIKRGNEHSLKFVDFPRNLGFDDFPMAHRVAEVVATEVTQNTGATFPWFVFFVHYFFGKNWDSMLNLNK
jgi:hypothetical protein